MNLYFVIILLMSLTACSLQKVESQPIADNLPPQTITTETKQPVLVELFTSEGCSSCPPADRALALLQKEQPNSQAEIITLAFHVDYWNNLGWKDEYSSDLFTQRQQFYSRKFKLDSIYTPQMVVDGKFEFVGSNLGKAQQAITNATKEAKAIVIVKAENSSLKIDISQIPAHQDSTVYLAIAENNIATNVKRGENAGNKLEHISVVRELQMVGKIADSDDKFNSDYAYQTKPDWKRENLKFVVFVQENESRKILGVNFSTN